MTSSVPLQPVSTGSSSHTRLPFTGHGPMVVRQETVLSAPRSADADPSAPVDPTPSESSVSRRLFPEQVQQAHSDDVIGTTLDHFVIESRVGAGGMGTVFLARDQRLQRRVALKVLSPQQTADPSAVQRFQGGVKNGSRREPNSSCSFDCPAAMFSNCCERERAGPNSHLRPSTWWLVCANPCWCMPTGSETNC